MKIFCNQCGSENVTEDNFCVKCGNKLNKEILSKENEQKRDDLVTDSLDTIYSIKEKWWYRLLRVLYFISYIPLLIILPIVWEANAPYCYSYSCSNQSNESFWYSLFTLIVYIIVIRLIKLAIKYIIFGKPPEWREEIKRIY